MKIGVNVPIKREHFQEQLQAADITLRILKIAELDQKLPTLDGVILYVEEDQEMIVHWIKEIRNRSSLPIWVCMAQKKVKMWSLLFLYLGVDGVFEAVDVDEMIVVMRRTVIRRNPLGVTGKEEVIELIPESMCLKITQKKIPLTQLEYRFCSILLENVREVVCYEKLIEYLWGEIDEGGAKAQLANVATHLRKKLTHSAKELTIKTIRTKGYLLKVADSNH